MSTVLLIVRHGQTEWNKEERFRGRSDLPLNAVGVREAEAVAERIAAQFRPVAIYTSPLPRAVATADTIARALGLQPSVDDGLLDLDYGGFAGLSVTEAETRYPHILRSWTAAPHTVHFPDGEMLNDVQERVVDLVDRLAVRHPDQQVVLVTHLVVCRVLLSSLLHLHVGHINALEIDAASLSVARLSEGAARIVSVNDTCHLTDAVRADA
jgi:broad specificity phosphatase PhoE